MSMQDPIHATQQRGNSYPEGSHGANGRVHSPSPQAPKWLPQEKHAALPETADVPRYSIWQKIAESNLPCARNTLAMVPIRWKRRITWLRNKSHDF